MGIKSNSLNPLSAKKISFKDSKIGTNEKQIINQTRAISFDLLHTSQVSYSNNTYTNVNGCLETHPLREKCSNFFWIYGYGLVR